MRITNPDEVKVGHWYSLCCDLDLYEIEDEETMCYLSEDMRETQADERLGWRVWDSEESALADLEKK